MDSRMRSAGTELDAGFKSATMPAIAALSTNELLGLATRELRREQKTTKGNQRLILRRSVARLHDMGLLNAWERGQLDRVCSLTLVAARSGTLTPDVAKRLRTIHDEMISRNAGPLALTVAEVAANLDRLSNNPQNTGRPASIARADDGPNYGHLMVGGIAGALAGGLAGGPLGAAIGFVAGWVGRGLVDAC